MFSQVRVETPLPHDLPYIPPPVGTSTQGLTLAPVAPDLHTTDTVGSTPTSEAGSTVQNNPDETDTDTIRMEVRDDLDRWGGDKVSRLPVFDKMRRTR